MALPSSLDWVTTVSMTVGFAKPLDALRSEHIGLFWHRVRGEYPKVEQTPPHARALRRPGLLSSLNRGQFPMSGYRFLSGDGKITWLFRQEDLWFAWHRVSGEPSDFDGFFVSAFETVAGHLEDFVREELDVPGISSDLCRLSLTGEIEYPDVASGVDWLPGIEGLSRAPDIGVALSHTCDFGFTFDYDLDSGLHIQVGGGLEFDGGRLPQSEFDLDLTGSQRLGQAGRSEVDGWLKSAYQSILDCYLSLSAEPTGTQS